MTVTLHHEGYHSERDVAASDITVPTNGSPEPDNLTPVVVHGFEVEEAGRYEITLHGVIQCGMGSNFNEANFILVIDNSFVVPRADMSSNHTSVALRWTCNWSRKVVLAEGGHVARLMTWTFNTSGTLIWGSGGDDMASLTVRRLA
jgi:hypothetical protein